MRENTPNSLSIHSKFTLLSIHSLKSEHFHSFFYRVIKPIRLAHYIIFAVLFFSDTCLIDFLLHITYKFAAGH